MSYKIIILFVLATLVINNDKSSYLSLVVAYWVQIYMVIVVYSIKFQQLSKGQTLSSKNQKVLNFIIGFEQLLLLFFYMLPFLFINSYTFSNLLELKSNSWIRLNQNLFYYLSLLILCLINRYFIHKVNAIILNFGRKTPNPHLENAEKFSNKKFTQKVLYFAIALVLVISQIDKGLYNVFQTELSEVLIPVTVSFIAIERALKSIGIE